MTSSPLRTVWGVGEIRVSRIGRVGSGVPAEVGVGQRLLAGDGVGDDDPRAGAVAQREGAAPEVEAQLVQAVLARELDRAPEAGRDALLEELHISGRRVLEVARGLVGEALLQWREQCQRRHAERDDARGHQRGEQPRAQAEGPAPGHCSRKR